MFIDTHAHIYWETLAPKLDEVLENARIANVWKIICIWCSEEATIKAKNLAEKYDQLYFTVWVHPTDWEDSINWENLESMIESSKCVWIWECWFDFYHDKAWEKKQEKIFIKQISLAEKYSKSLIIHTRNAWEKVLDLLKDYSWKFVIHCFTEWKDFAARVVKMWWYISIWWIITYSKADAVRDVIKDFPLDKIMLETDCPFLAPQSVRGKVNEPANIPEIALKLSEITWVWLSEIEEITQKNSECFFWI